MEFQPVGITVRDQGPGIAPDVLARLGDRFFRGGGTQREHGHGLGVSIALRVARLHGLDLAFANRSDGATGLVVTIARGGTQ
ncbi:Sensor protein QseC [compost metagenome]